MMVATPIKTYTVTATLTAEEYELLEAFAAEQGIEALHDALPVLLHELVRLHDQQWEAQFTRSGGKIDKLAQQALDDHHAGLSEDFDAPAP